MCRFFFGYEYQQEYKNKAYSAVEVQVRQGQRRADEGMRYEMGPRAGPLYVSLAHSN